MNKYHLTHLKELEAESIFIIREVVAQFENPVLLFSGGKDSIVCHHLARKAYYPANVPFPLSMWIPAITLTNSINFVTSW